MEKAYVSAIASERTDEGLDENRQRKEGRRAADGAGCCGAVIGRDRQHTGRLAGHAGQNDGVGGGQQRGEMVMVRERTAVVGEAAIRVPVGLGGFQGHRGGGIVRVEMERGEKLEADVPNEREQQKRGTAPPEKRQGLRGWSLIWSCLKLHRFPLVFRLTQLDAKGGGELPGGAEQ